ncbi:PDR/VanB family oxidoreductase [Sulfuritalea sp.]|uniref:PDR/VanB family oxidoreductase n=1 Tax=Sulfuritalea sp. TaxID=2480090 RepID=UPI001ACCA5B7|nr:PDR/VanB family oxidoreductase [Sulfuritalea sp.]MBN8476328.1 oxidoreductase [Sulfuritalea sp.]
MHRQHEGDTSEEKNILVRIMRKEIVAQNIARFELVARGGKSLPPFAAGAHIDVHLPNGMVRQYSLCNSPEETHRYVLGVLRDTSSRGGSVALHDQVQEGDDLTISQPRNHFPLVASSRKSLLLAGGIGITPILAMAESLSMHEEDFDLHYCGRNASRMAFTDLLRCARYSDHVKYYYDDGVPEQRLNLSKVLAFPSPDTHLYVCGPQGFIEAVKSSAQVHGWLASNVHYEYFGATAVAGAADKAFSLHLNSNGSFVLVAPGQTAIAALATAGITVPASCEQGVCGTCLTRVLEGEPDHRDHYLTPAEQKENRQFLPCVSRAKSDVLKVDL